MTDEIDPRIYRIVWKRLGNRSTRQIADETGLTPEQVFALKREMIEGVDDLTILQKKHKLLVELEEISQDARDAADNASDEFRAGLYNSSIAAMKTMLTELTRFEKQDQAKVDSLNSLRVRELMALMREVVDTSVLEIAEKHNLDADDLFPIFNLNFVKAAQKRDELE